MFGQVELINRIKSDLDKDKDKRPVRVMKYERCALVFDFVGEFHQWGTELEEDDRGLHEVTVGIIELKDGTIKTAYSNLIQFTDKE